MLSQFLRHSAFMGSSVTVAIESTIAQLFYMVCKVSIHISTPVFLYTALQQTVGAKKQKCGHGLPVGSLETTKEE